MRWVLGSSVSKGKVPRGSGEHLRPVSLSASERSHKRVAKCSKVRRHVINKKKPGPRHHSPLLRLEPGFSCATLARMPFSCTSQPRPNLRLSFTNRYNFGEFHF
jgi:hypothetical protein